MKNPQTTFEPTFFTHIIARIDGVIKDGCLPKKMFLATGIGDLEKFHFIFVVYGQGDVHFVQDVLFHGKGAGKFIWQVLRLVHL